MERETSSAKVSQLLQAWSDGDKTALDRLTPIVYKELRTLDGALTNGIGASLRCRGNCATAILARGG